ncbi:MAG: hypothetical protein OXB92_14930 [Acidimicrobiaceae bacterium]|nr:hypothetical protein [Acidimicrobiaceae bacterium]
MPAERVIPALIAPFVAACAPGLWFVVPAGRVIPALIAPFVAA